MRESVLLCRREADGLYIDGIAVPWDEEIEYRGVKESFAPGGLVMEEMAPTRYGHQRDDEGFPIPIGKVVRQVDTDEGLWTSSKLTPGPISEQAWHAANEGIVRGFSVEFKVPGQTGSAGQGRVTDGIGIGLVLTENPAYAGARITAVRARTPRWEHWQRELERLRG